MHVVRPDRVYRTSVLSPIPGYQPGPDVQAVAQAFTNGGTMLRIPVATHATLSGFSGFLTAPPLTWWQRLKIRIEAKRSEKRARRMMAKLAKLNLPNGGTAGLFGPEPAHQGMAMVAARISAGYPPMPSVARTQLQMGTSIIPSSSGIPLQLAMQAVQGSPPYVAQRAAAYGYNNWAKKRRWWFDT